MMDTPCKCKWMDVFSAAMFKACIMFASVYIDIFQLFLMHYCRFNFCFNVLWSVNFSSLIIRLNVRFISFAACLIERD